MMSMLSGQWWEQNSDWRALKRDYEKRNWGLRAETCFSRSFAVRGNKKVR